MLDGHQRILHSFIDQSVHAGHKEVDGTKQSLPVFAQQLLRLRVVSELVLQRKTL